MKILMVNKFLYPRGGAETYMLRIGEELTRRGHQVEYFGMYDEKNTVGNAEGLTTVNMDFHASGAEKLLYPFRIIYSGEARRKMRQVIDRFHPDIIHFNNINFQLTPSVILAGAEKNIPMVQTVHDLQMLCPNHMMMEFGTWKLCEECSGKKCKMACVRKKCIHGSRAKSLIGAIEGTIYTSSHVYDRVARYICPSRFIEEKLLTVPRYAGKTTMIHNFLSKTAEIDVPKGDYILYFGRLSEEKGIDRILAACRLLPEIPFVIAGGGPLEELCRTCGLPNVRFVGFKTGKELQELVAAARFTLHLSLWYENCPLALLESQSLGTPVLCNRIGGMPELVEEGKTGVLNDTFTPEAYAEKIRALYSDSALLDEMARKEGKHDDARPLLRPAAGNLHGGNRRKTRVMDGKKRKVMFLIYSLCGGGAERVLVETVNRLPKDRYDVTLMTLFHDDTRAGMLSPEVHYRPALRVKNGRVQKILSGIIQYIIPPKWLYRWFFRSDADVEVAFMEAFPTKILAYSTNQHAKKYAWVHIDVQTYTKQDRLFRSMRHQKACYERFDGIYCVSENVQEAFSAKFGLTECVHVAYNMLDEQAIRRRKNEPVDDIPKGEFLMVSVGSLIPRKGFERLIHVCGLLKSRGYHFHLLILGKGELYEDLAEQVIDEHLQDSVQLLGFRDNPYPYMAAADLYVCPSYVEGFSTVVSEAVVLETPVVTTDCSGMREILGDSEYGLITRNTEESLFEGLRTMLDKPEVYQYYQQRVRERAPFFYMEERLKAYEEILDQ